MNALDRALASVEIQEGYGFDADMTHDNAQYLPGVFQNEELLIECHDMAEERMPRLGAAHFVAGVGFEAAYFRPEPREGMQFGVLAYEGLLYALGTAPRPFGDARLLELRAAFGAPFHGAANFTKYSGVATNVFVRALPRTTKLLTELAGVYTMDVNHVVLGAATARQIHQETVQKRGRDLDSDFLDSLGIVMPES